MAKRGCFEKENINPDSVDFKSLKKSKRKSPKKSKRFKPPTSESEMMEITKGFVPENTKKSTTWATRVFKEWVLERNVSAEEQCPVDLVQKPDPKLLNFWLCRFVTEVRKKDGSPYPPRSIHLILAGLQRIVLEISPNAPKFFDQSDSTYRDLRRSCDTIYRELRSQGIGTEINRTPIFTMEEEEKLWDTGVFNINDPVGLQRAVFFYIGKRFCIRGGEEQRKLGPSQLKRSSDPDCYMYIEHGSKNRSGGLEQLKVDNKCVPCYAVPEQSPRCLVYLLDLYFDKLPLFAFQNDVLYCRPKKCSSSSPTWYEGAPVGKNKLGNMVKEMCLEAGIESKTNHSLRATGATSLFRSNVPEKIIQSVTGHRSLEALRKYEKTSDDQHQAVSKIMMSSKSIDYETQVRVSMATPRSSSIVEDQVKQIFGNVSNCSIGSITLNIGSDACGFLTDEKDVNM